MNKIGWLSELYYEVGKQQTNFRLTHTYKKDGAILFTKWVKYLDAQSKDEIINAADQREQLKNEIIFDQDEGDFKELIDKLRKDGIKFYAYSTEENRARQIHTYWKGLAILKKKEREDVRTLLIRKYGCDLNLRIDAHVIPIEFEKHWKTGKTKNLIDKEEGINNAEPIIEEIDKINKEKEIKTQSILGLKIDNFQDNVNHFWNINHFFYDETNIFWFWDKIEFRWRMVDDVFMMSLLDKRLGFCGQTVTSTIKSNYLEAFKRVGRDHKPEPAPTKWIQFKNKAISLKSGNVYDITHDYFFTNPIPWNIGNSEDTPTMDKLIVEWVGEEYKQTAYEIIAYCCYSDYPIHMILCLVGCGRNGKSKFLGLINKFIGKDNVCSTELDVLLDSRFESFKLFKKLVCTMGETNFGVISKTSLLKKLTGQDLIGFEYKQKKPFDDYNYAKIIISSNSLPPSEDTSEGFYRRWLILDFPNTFPEGHDILKTIPEIEYNNLALKVSNILPKLLENGKFNKQGTIKERMEKYIMASNPLSFFIKEHCKRGYDCFMRYSELYVAYRKYLHSIKRRKIGYKEFNDVLTMEGFEVVKTSKRIGEEYVNGRFIEGIELVPLVPLMLKSSTLSPYRERVSDISTNVTNVTNEEPIYDTIHAKCKVCGTEPSHIYNKQGEPMCEDCYKAEQAQKGLK